MRARAPTAAAATSSATAPSAAPLPALGGGVAAAAFLPWSAALDAGCFKFLRRLGAIPPESGARQL